jgi:hypothetical protein
MLGVVRASPTDGPSHHPRAAGSGRPAVDVTDDTFIRCPPASVAPAIADPAAWAAWWPGLVLAVSQDRGAKGLRWLVAGRLTGSMEIWLEPVATGTVLHWFLRADPPVRQSPRGYGRLRDREVLAWKRHAFALKDRLEGAERVT